MKRYSSTSQSGGRHGRRPMLSDVTDEIEKNERQARTLPAGPGRRGRFWMPAGSSIPVGGKRKNVKVSLAKKATDF